MHRASARRPRRLARRNPPGFHDDPNFLNRTHMQNMTDRLSSVLALLVGGLALALVSGCAGGNPYIGEAESNLENQNFDGALAYVDSALAQPSLTPEERAEIFLLQARVYQTQADSSDDAQRHAELIQNAVVSQDSAIALNPGVRSNVQSQRQLRYIQEMQSGAQQFRNAQQGQNQQAYANAASYFQAASTIYPDSASAYLNEAYALINAGDQSAAISPMQNYVEEADSVGADQYTLLGQLFLTNDRAEDAIPVLEQGADDHPDNSDIQSLLLNAYNAAGQTEQAIAAYREQVQNNPNNALYLYNLGSLLLNEERYDEAIQYLGRAVEQDPSNANAQYNYGAAHVNKAVAVNDEIAALEDSLRSNEQEMADAEAQQLNSQIESLAEERTELFQDAIPPLERALELTESSSPNRQGICRALFSAYVQTEQQDEAEEIQECAGLSDQQMNQ
jgi:tetratricopeptide (TPR) repeat protein